MSDYAIPFTQYVRPDGRTKEVAIPMPKDIWDKAQEIIQKGFRFEVESLVTGQVSLTIVDDEMNRAIHVCENGPGVADVVKLMVENFHKILHKVEPNEMNEPEKVLTLSNVEDFSNLSEEQLAKAEEFENIWDDDDDEQAF